MKSTFTITLAVSALLSVIALALLGFLQWMAPAAAPASIPPPLVVLSILIPLVYGIAPFLRPVVQGLLQKMQRLYPSDTASRAFSKSFLVLCVFGCLSNSLNAQITGTVFRDFNANGTLDVNDAGIGGVIVNAYDDDDPIATPTATTTTNSNGPALSNVGTYTLPGLTVGVQYRLEFSWPTVGAGNLSFLEPGAAGGTTVQVATAGATNVNVAINSDGQYCGNIADIKIITTCAITGNPFAAGNNLADDKILIQTDYIANGTIPAAVGLATASQVGGYLHGVAKDPLSNRVFSANTLKRHASLGPDRLNPSSAGSGGAIYVTNLSAALPNGAVYIDLVNDLAINVGQASIPNNATRGLPSIKGNASLDATVFGLVGKVGLGDIELSDGGANLYVVNLFDRRIHVIPTADVDNGAPYSSSVLPDFPGHAGCTNGVARPFGLTFHDGDIYLGVVCTGELNVTTNTNADLVAYVYYYDLDNSSGGGWSTAITFPLTYSKGFAEGTDAGTNQWYNWADTYTNANLPGGVFGSFTQGQHRPQPILADIEFDEDGSMVLGFMDRTGNQLGHRNTPPNNIGGLITGVSAGDILRTYLDPATGLYTLESAGVAGPYTSSGTGLSQNGPGGPASNQGPGGGEFFWQDRIGTQHSETSNGGLAICPGTREVVLSAFDPLTDLDAAGYVVFNSTNGAKNRGFQLYFDPGSPPASGTTGKAGGIGDIEFLLDAQPIEVGNYIWNDIDKDGIQDPGESAFSAVTVELWADTDNNGSVDTKVAETTTNANGQYLFSYSTNPNSPSPETWTVGTKVLPSTAYEIRVPTGQVGLTGFSLTGQNTAASGGIATNNNLTDLRDSDAGTVATNAVIAFTTGTAGRNNHTLDMGFFDCPTITNPSVAQTICEGSAGANITVNTNRNVANSIRFVRFAADQTAVNGSPTALELATIYAGSTVLATVTPTGGASPYTATLTSAAAGWAATAPGVYYIYAILNPDPGALCRPVQEIIVTIVDKPELTANDLTVCESVAGVGTTVNLTNLVQNPDGATLAFSEGGNPIATPNAANLAVGPHTITVVATATGLPLCSTTVNFTVTIVDRPDPTVTNGQVCGGSSIDLATLVTSANGGTLTYYTTLANAQAGTNALVSPVVTLTAATNYYVRSAVTSNGTTCHGVREITVTIAPADCGSATVTGGN